MSDPATQPTRVSLRPIVEADFDRVLAWNHENVTVLAPMDRAKLVDLLGIVDLGAVIEADGEPAGFVFTFAPGAAYASANFSWFAERHQEFLYLDRIVIDPSVRRSGVATGVYEQVEERARRFGPVLCLEVNLDPPNVASLAFHRRRGFAEVGQFSTGGPTLSMMEKAL